MSIARINSLNIFLMVVAACAALVYPVGLFVLAYAVLGPLHYLTEISWLDKRGYFLPVKKQSYVFFALSLITTATLLVPRYYLPVLPLLAFVLAVVFVFPKKKNYLLLGLAVSAVGLLYFYEIGPLRSIVLLLPTLLHVSLFTFLFIFTGAVKSKGLSGYLSLAIYILCFVFIILFSAIIPHGLAGASMMAANGVIAPYIYFPMIKLFHMSSNDAGILLCQRVIAFSYLYHYLNWFSKTGIIQWHKIPAQRLGIILFVYALNLAFYYQSFYLGFLMSYLLSIGHVYLEFPLNIRSMKEALPFASIG